MINEHYPTLAEMMPWKKNPIRWKDGWNVFRGPKLGSLAPDDFLVAQSNQPQTTLHTLMDQMFTQSDKQFFVILFGGTECGDVCPNMKMFADALEHKYPKLLDAFAVTPFYDDQVYDPVKNILGDLDGSCEVKYGATGTAIYVIDREKKIVWKSSGLMKEKLYLYLNSMSDSV